MGILDNFEKGLERVVNGAFAKTFKSGLQPLEVTAALRRELDTKAAVVSRDRILVPNNFTVRLAPGDYERMTDLGPALIDEFTQLVQRHATAQHYAFAGGISIRLAARPALSEGMVRIDSVNVKGEVAWTPVLDIGGKRYPITKAPHRHRPRIGCRHHGRRHRHLPQARRDPLGRQARPGQRPRLDQRLEAQRAAASRRPRCRPTRSSRSAAPASSSACSPSRLDRPVRRPAQRAPGSGRAVSELTLLRAAARVPHPAVGVRLRHRLRAALRPVRATRAPQLPAAGARARRSPPRSPRPPSPAVVAAAAPVVPVTERAPRAAARRRTDTPRRLVITSGPREGIEIDLPSEQLTIGRSSESGLVIRDDYTSTHHARLMLWNDEWVIQDLDSTNGTFLDGVARDAPDSRAARARR